jgi:hypothetical protein
MQSGEKALLDNPWVSITRKNLKCRQSSSEFSAYSLKLFGFHFVKYSSLVSVTMIREIFQEDVKLYLGNWNMEWYSTTLKKTLRQVKVGINELLEKARGIECGVKTLLCCSELFIYNDTYIEPMRNLRLYKLEVRQAKQTSWHGQYPNRDHKYPDRGVVSRWEYHFTWYPDWAVKPDCQTGHLGSIRKWPTDDTRKFPNVTMNRIRILPTKFAFKDHFIVKILTR